MITFNVEMCVIRGLSSLGACRDPRVCRWNYCSSFSIFDRASLLWDQVAAGEAFLEKQEVRS